MQDGLKKVVNGLTSFEEILRVIDIETDFGDGDEELRMALLGKLPTNKTEKKKKNETTENEITETTTQTEKKKVETNKNITTTANKTAETIKKVDPNNPSYEIPTEEKLSFNQGNVDFGKEMSYDDFGDDYDDDY